MPRDPVIPADVVAALLALSGSDLPLPWREMLRDPLSVLGLAPDPDLFPGVSLPDLCAMASAW